MCRTLFCALLIAGMAGACRGAILVDDDPGAIPKGLAVEDFESYPLESTFSVLDNSVLGIHFGEKFVGQTNTPNTGGSDPFDLIGGTPTTPLALDTSVAAIYGVDIHLRRSNTIAGLGPRGYPAAGAIAEGSVAALFDFDQSVITFDLANFDNNIHEMSVQLFDRSGLLLADITLNNPQLGPFIFTSTGAGIAAIVVDQGGLDTGGIMLDNFRFQSVPEPSTIALLAIGLVTLASDAGGVKRRWLNTKQKKRRAK